MFKCELRLKDAGTATYRLQISQKGSIHPNISFFSPNTGHAGSFGFMQLFNFVMQVPA